MQEYDSVLHTVAYYGKQHNTAQRNYSTVEKECLAVVQALKHFEVYLNPTDAYPLRRIDDLLDFVRIAKFVTKIDLLKGYHQISLHPNSLEKTVFVTPDGLYQINVLRFGLRNTPATF